MRKRYILNTKSRKKKVTKRSFWISISRLMRMEDPSSFPYIGMVLYQYQKG